MKIMQAQRKSAEEILHLFNEKDIDDGWSFAGFKPSDTGKWTHCYHRYPAVNGKVKVYQFRELKSVPPTPMTVVL